MVTIVRSGTTRRSSILSREVLRWLFLAILVVWVAVGATSAPGQDAVPYVVAGHLARSHPEDVYPPTGADASHVSARFRAAACVHVPAGANCDDWALAYVSSPQMLPFAVLLDRLRAGLGVRFMTIGSSLLLAAGMWLLWHRLADGAPTAPVVLVVTALAVSPLALFAIFMGQTSPVMFLSVCLGVVGSRSRRVVAGVTWALSSTLKLFPALLGFLLLRRRRRDMLVTGVVTVVALTIVSVVVLPGSIWADFLGNMTRWDSSADPKHIGASIATNLVRLLGSSPLTRTIATGSALAAAGVFAVSGLRRGSDDAKWAVGYVALLLAAPIVWNHYLLVLVGATGIVLADRPRLGRELYLLPVVGFVVSVPMLLNGVVAESVRISSQPICLLVGAATVLWILHLPGSTESTADAAPEPQRSW